LGTKRLMVDGLHNTVSAWVVRGDNRSATVLLTNHALPKHSIKTEKVKVHLTHAPKPLKAYVERVDETHANATRVWRQMKKPEYLTREQLTQLQKASELVKETQSWKEEAGGILLEVDLPPHAIAAITIELAPAPKSSRAAGGRKTKPRPNS
ncbi:MAG: hypothetical protein M3Y03_05170, partial [Verrucomicrobiota bacterium]|nr:hypothetical protein [Verrucomicrobiota bacterium]